MGKASSRKRQTPPATAPVRPAPPWSEAPSWAATVLLIAAAAGMLLSALSAWDHYQLVTAPGYASFCDVSESINCEEVVTSPWGTLFGVPVSVWGFAFYALLAFVALRVRSAEPGVRDPARADAFALVLFGAGFSAYLASVSLFVLDTLCPVCAGLYGVSALALVAGIVLARPPRVAFTRWGDRLRTFRRRPLLASSGAVAAASVLLLPGVFGAPKLMTKEEVFQAEPGFYEWYTTRPIVDIPEGTGQPKGPEGAPLTIVEFSDFQCPHCQRAHVLMQDLLPRFQDRIRFVFHHYPLSNECNPAVKVRGHAFACEAAIAAECAARQGKFDSFANLLFARQDELGSETVEQIADEVGLEEDRFEECIDGEAARQRVRADVAVGDRVGIRSTPTFFVNGRRIEGNLSTERWLYAIGIELDRE